MNADLLAKLIEAGTPAALVAEVAVELGRAQAACELLEHRRSKDRERKRVPRNSTESEETTEFQAKVPSEVSPQTPLPTNLQNAPLSPPRQILIEKREAIGSCLRKAYPPPEGVSDEQWSAFRKQRKKALNERSYALVLGKLGELAKAGHAPGAMIDLAIERGWETVFEPREFVSGKQVAPAKPKITDSRVIATNKRATAAIYEKMGRSDEAAQLRREAAQLDQQQAA